MDKQKVLFYSLLIGAVGLAYATLLLAQHISEVYLLLLIPAAVLGVLTYFQYRRMYRLKLLRELRQAWGGEGRKKDRNFEDVALVFQYAENEEGTIDDRTWHDLNMDLVFAQLDRTFTWPGMQRLYQILRSPIMEKLSVLDKRSEMIRSFQVDQAQREDVQLILKRMDGRIGAGLARLLWTTPTVPEILPRFVYTLMALVALLSPLLLFFGLRWLIVLPFIFQVNMYLHFKVQKTIKAYFEGVRALGQLINVGKRLSKLDYPALQEPLAEIEKAYAQVKGFLKIMRHVGVETTDPMLSMMTQYYAILFLAEVRGFYRSLDFISAHRGTLQNLFLAVGELDALQGVASYRTYVPYYCEPQVSSQQKRFNLVDAYHPLVADCVPNSISVDKRGILVTGSNMSGKSTFLRTVGLNVLLAQSIATCLAREYEAVPVQLLTCIGRADNVVEGKSYYLEEALGVKRVVEAVDSNVTTFAIFDEMFRGTNSEERIFAARRVLEYLIKRKAIVFVATHDLELADLLADSYRSVHFSERLSTVGLEFDYKLKEGPTTTRNAVALLRYLDYPREITD